MYLYIKRASVDKQMIYILYLKETQYFSEFDYSISTDNSSVVLHHCTNFQSIPDNNGEVRNPLQQMKFTCCLVITGRWQRYQNC